MASAEQPRRGAHVSSSPSAEDELIVVVPISSSRAASKLRPPVSPPQGLTAPSAAIPRAVRAVSRRRLLRRLGEVGPEKLVEVERALALVLGLGALA